MQTVFDVTTFNGSVSPFQDIGKVINEILAQVKKEQTTQTTRPGAVIYIPPGHYDLLTRVVIDISYVQIKGSGHGFQSLAIRDGSDTGGWVDTLPGASHVQVRNTDGTSEAFLVRREGSPTDVGRLNSIEFRDFLIDGVSAEKPYVPGNGRTGISIASDNDSVRIEGMGFVYLTHAMVVRGADAAWITGNFVAECGSCVELTGASQVVRVSNNTLVSAWAGASVYAEHAEGLHVTGNTMVWHGSVHMVNCSRANITSNKFVSSWPGMLLMEGACDENLVSGNTFTRVDTESTNDNGQDDLFGMIQVNGTANSVTTNLFSYRVADQLRRPPGARATTVLVKSGADNLIMSNSISGTDNHQVVLDASTRRTKVIHTVGSDNLAAYTDDHALVPMP
jgi:inulin fructotransferase [DFA-I-forming]